MTSIYQVKLKVRIKEATMTVTVASTSTSKSTILKVVRTSCPKAPNDQRLPCPALLFSVFMGGSRVVSPKGDRVL